MQYEEDGQVLWHDPRSKPFRPITLLLDNSSHSATGELSCEHWMRHPLRCAITHSRLTSPAKCGTCRHLPSCNYDALVQYVRSRRGCPIFGCVSVQTRLSDVARDDALSDAFSALPEAAEVCWVRAGSNEVRLQPPPVIADASSVSAPAAAEEVPLGHLELGEIDEVKDEVADSTLYASSRNISGYRGVYPLRNGKRFLVKHARGGCSAYLGTFSTAAEAAAVYAKHVAECPCDEDEAEAARAVAKANGLVTKAAGMTLHLSRRSTATGYVGVKPARHGSGFEAVYQRSKKAGQRGTTAGQRGTTAGQRRSIGVFKTAVKAAVAYAKHVEKITSGRTLEELVEESAERKAEKRAAEAVAAKKKEEQTRVVSKAEGYQLHLSSESLTGYRNVKAHGNYPCRRFQACFNHPDGSRESIGYYKTAVKAAVAYAKYVADVDTVTTVVTKAKGYRLHLSHQCKTGYRGVYPNHNRFAVVAKHGGKDKIFLGPFDTAIQGAVAYAKHLKERASGEWKEPDVMSEADVVQTKGLVKKAAGYQLHISLKNSSGYLGVSKLGRNRWQANSEARKQRRGGKISSYIGGFDTAVEAAVAYARHVENLQNADD